MKLRLNFQGGNYQQGRGLLTQQTEKTELIEQIEPDFRIGTIKYL